MSLFAGANVVVHAASDSPYRQPRLEILGAVARGDAVGFMSTAALEEVWDIELSGRLEGLTGVTGRAHAVSRRCLRSPMRPSGGRSRWPCRASGPATGFTPQPVSSAESTRS